jgi:Kef-type K+ transport system membrane component KefB
VASTARALGREIFGSLLAGLPLGVLVGLFLKKVARGGALFVLAVGFVVAEVGQRIHLDPLLIALAMGMFIRNATSVGDRLLSAIETGSLPIYVAFFGVAGATIHLDMLPLVGLPAVLFVLVRGAGLLAGSNAAARLAKAPEAVQRFAGFGLLPQAGLALALALMFRRTFPSFGEAASTLVFAVVAINELFAPIFYRIALVKSGEAGRLGRAADASLENPRAVETGATQG